MRRVLAVMAVASFVGLAIGSAIYLATPRYASRWHTPPAQARVKTTAVTNEPGTVDLQIQRQKEAQTYRFRKVGEDWVIQNVTPKPVPHKRFPWSKPRQTGS